MKKNKKEVLTWIKTQPELEHVRKLASQAEFIYDKESLDPSQRLKIYNRPKYNRKKSFRKKLIEAIWVPGYKLRGNDYADKNFDAQLDQTASIMSLSTIWDLICTSPVLFYFTKAAGAAAIPLSFAYGILLLLMSNKSGEFAMNRPKEGNKAASFLLLIFFGLSLVKTLMSGVGIDLVSRAGEIKDSKARDILQKNVFILDQPKSAYSDLLNSSINECNRLVQEQSKLNPSKSGERRLYRELQDRMYAKPNNTTNRDPKYLIDNYLFETGPCLQKDLISSFIGKDQFNTKNASNIKSNLISSLPPIDALYVFQRNQFYNTFTGNPLVGSDTNLEKYKSDFMNSDIEFKLDCYQESSDCNKKVEWKDPGMAINEASKQFYGRFIKQDYQNFGLSFVGFLISIFLSLTATVLLYTASLDKKNRASRSSHLADLKNQYYTDLLEEDN
tara:strand:- start:1450 stop:2781 length:1332 start_codon:yes stop_codon:yes gene_type:complete